MSVLKKFNPYDLPDALVRVIATGREAVLGEIVDTIAANVASPILQHLLIVAPRGFGKSFLLRLLQIELKGRAAEDLPVRFVVLPEEQPNVTAPHLLLDETCRVLEGRPAADVVASWFDEEDTAWERSLKRLEHAVEASSPGAKGFVVVAVENFDHLMATVFREDEDASRLRKLLASEGGRLMLLATAADRVDAAYGGRLFHAFRTIELRPWEEDQCLTFFSRLRLEISQRELGRSERPKALAVAQFIGGSPRMATILYEVLQTHDSMQAIGLLDGLVDELTPYYKHRIESLSPRARALLDTLLRMGEPRSQSEVAAKLGTTQNRVAQPFAELLGQQILIGERSALSRETLYRVTDRLMVHYYRKRIFLHGAGGSPLEAITEFLEGFFTEEEKQTEAERLRGLGFEREAALFEGMLSRSREAAALTAVIDPDQPSDALQQASQLIEAGQPSAGIEMALAARQYAARQGEPKRELAAMAMVVAGLMPVDTERAVSAAREALSLADTTNDNHLLAMARCILGLSLVGADCPDEAVQWLNLARGGLRGAKDLAALLQCDVNLAETLVHLEKWDQAIEVWQEAEKLAVGRQNKAKRIRVLEGLVRCLSQQRKYAGATKVMKTLMKVAEESSDLVALVAAAGSAAELALRRERFQDATHWAEEAVRLTNALGDPRGVTAATCRLGGIWFLTGRIAEAANVMHPFFFQEPEFDRKSATALNHMLFATIGIAIANGGKDLALLLEQIGRVRTEGDHMSTILAFAALTTGYRNTGDYNESVNATEELLIILGSISIGEDPLVTKQVRSALDSGAYSAIRGGRWPELWGRFAEGWAAPELSNSLPGSIATAINEEASENGRAKAFELIAAVIDHLAEEAARSAPAPPRLDALAVLRRATADLASRLQDAGLLRDVATHLAHRLPTATESEQALLEAAALHVEGGGADSALERVDPDIAAAIRRTRGKRRPELPQTHTRQRRK